MIKQTQVHVFLTHNNAAFSCPNYGRDGIFH